MGYIIDGIALTMCIGAYRVYTDRRKSSIHNNWSCYQLLWLNLSRYAGDFAASAFFKSACVNPDQARNLVKKCARFMNIADSTLREMERNVCVRSARYALWSNFGKLSYLQRITKVESSDTSFPSLFSTKRAWRSDLVFTTPQLLRHIKDAETRKYVETLCLVRDPHTGIIEASPSGLRSMLDRIQDSRRDIIQDIRKGHILDRKAQSSIPMVHQLRLDLEGFLFGNSGPDPGRSSYVEKVLKNPTETGQVIEGLFPFLEVIVCDTKEDVSLMKQMVPNVPVFVPFIRTGPSDRIVGINAGNNEYILNPFLDNLVTRDLSDSSAVEICCEGEIFKAIVTGKVGQMLKVKL